MGRGCGEPKEEVGTSFHKTGIFFWFLSPLLSSLLPKEAVVELKRTSWLKLPQTFYVFLSILLFFIATPAISAIKGALAKIFSECFM